MSINHKARKEADPVLQVCGIEHFPDQDKSVDGLSNGNPLLRNENEAGTPPRLNELAKVVLHRVHVMANQHPAVFRSRREHEWIAKAFQGHSPGSSKIHCCNLTERSRYDGVLEIGIRLEPDSHACFAGKRFRASSIRCWSSGLAGLAVRSSSSHFLSNS